MNLVKLSGKCFVTLGLCVSLCINSFVFAVADLSPEDVTTNPTSETAESSLLPFDQNASTGNGTAPVDAENIEGFQLNNENGDFPATDAFNGGYVTTTDGKAILVDGRPVLQERMEDGSPRFRIPEDGNGVLGLCDGLAGAVCLPSNLNKFTYQDPDEIPLVLMTYNQHKYNTEGIGTDSSVITDNNTQTNQSVPIPDLTQNDPGTTAPSVREACSSAAKSGSPLPSLSSGCIEAANEYLDEPIPHYCANDFMGPTMPSQAQSCADNSQVKYCFDSHQFVFADQDSKVSETKDDEDDKASDLEADKPEGDADPAESDAEEVGRDAEEALEEVEKDTEAEVNEVPRESIQEDSANQDQIINESQGVGIEDLNGQAERDSSTTNTASSTPHDIQILYGEDEDVNSDEDDKMPDVVTNEESVSGGFIDNNSDWFTDDGDLVDPDDFENKIPDDVELSEMEDILGLESIAEQADAEQQSLKSIEEYQEGASPTTDDVSNKSEVSPELDTMDVESLQIDLNAADEGIDALKKGLSIVDEKTGVKIIKSKDGFIAGTFSLKKKSDTQNQDNKLKLISGMNKEELMDRFNLSEDELDEKLSKCANFERKPTAAECLKEDASLFGELLIRQD